MNRPLVRRGELRRDSGGGRGGAGRDHALCRVAPGFGHRGALRRGRLDAHLQRASAAPRWRGRVAPGQLLVLRHLPGTHAALPGSPRLSPAHLGSPRLTSAHLGSPGSPRLSRLAPAHDSAHDSAHPPPLRWRSARAGSRASQCGCRSASSASLLRERTTTFPLVAQPGAHARRRPLPKIQHAADRLRLDRRERAGQGERHGCVPRSRAISGHFGW